MKFFLFSLLFLASLTTVADGGGSDAGNGGGVICINGVCKTLSEAGLRLSPEFDGVWIPENYHFSLVESRINNKLSLAQPIKADLFQMVFANSDHFRRVNVIDPKKLEEIKDLYKKLAFDSGFPFDPNNFTIVAFSSDNTTDSPMTYLLPEFFSLTPSQQTEILVHEGLYRGKPTSLLKPILQFESSIAEMNDSNNMSGCSTNNLIKVCINQHVIGFKLGLLQKSELIMAILALASSRSPDAPPPSRGHYDALYISTDINETPSKLMELTLDRLAVTKLGKVDSRIPYMFSKVKLLQFEKHGSSYPTATDYSYSYYYNWSDNDGVFQLGRDYSAHTYKLTGTENIPLLLPD